MAVVQLMATTVAILLVLELLAQVEVVVEGIVALLHQVVQVVVE